MKSHSVRRRVKEPRFSVFVIASIILHFSLLLGSVLSGTRSARADLSISPIYVQLYNPMDFPGFVKAGGGPSPENGSARKSEKQKAQIAPQPELKSKPKAVSLPKDSTKEELKKESGSEPSTGLTDEERRRLNEALSQIRSDVARGEASGAEAEWRGIIGEINTDIELRAYYQRASEVYKRNWVVPSSVPEDRNLRVRVVVRIDRYGDVMDYQVLSFSGNQALDRSVLKVLGEVKELPAPPLPLGAQWRSLGIEFRPFPEE